MSLVVVGGDSRLARAFLANPMIDHSRTFVTTRRSNAGSRMSLYLDLLKWEDFTFPEDTDRVAIVGGAISYAECETQYERSQYINCVSVPNLAKRALEMGAFVTFISSNRVFTADSIKEECDIPNPTFAYTQMKVEAERLISSSASELSQSHNLSILRLTKNVSVDTAPFGDWLNAIRKREPIVAFRDLYFAPILYAHSADALSRVLAGRMSGTFHLSGTTDLSYYEFAVGLYKYLGLDQKLVIGKRSQEVGVTLVDSHPVTALSMKTTRSILGISPIPVCQIYDFLKTNLDD